VKDFIALINVTILKLPPYFPDLATADFCLLPGLKSALKGLRFCDAADLTKNATRELKSLSQNGFQECFEHLHSRWQKFTEAQGEYYKGNIY
jgi:hypothetical protein